LTVCVNNGTRLLRRFYS